MPTKFWNWKETDAERILTISGPIAEESWWGDEVTPAQFKEELMAGEGNVCIYINSPGGDCFAASQIYNMLTEYKGKVTVKIESLAASAASVIAMAGDNVVMAPTAMLMIHNPATMAFGDHNDMQKAIDILNEVKESIINAYEIKTGLSRNKISKLMEEETWMNAKKAIELGFADGVIENGGVKEDNAIDNMIFKRHIVENAFINKLAKTNQNKPEPMGRSVAELQQCLYKKKYI